MSAGISIDRAKLAKLCQRHHIIRLALFGSVLREDFAPSSDVDVLVTFDPEHVPGFFGVYDIEQKLSELLGGRKIDLVTEKFLNARIHDRVLAAAEVQYAQG